MLPIEPLLPKLCDTLATQNNVVLQAPPGAGKTTRVPLVLLHSEWLGSQKIIMLEPRRLAARAAARFMAHQLNEGLGQTVGYRMRHDSQVGPTTRIEVVTEGVLTRMLQQDPALEGVGVVIFDEFHERSLAADLGLALCLDVQSVLREDLRLLVMSATLASTAVATLLGGAPVLTSEGRSYPVTQQHRPVQAQHARDRRAFCHEVAQNVRQILDEETGSVLLFLPGAAEIRQVEAALQAAGLAADITLTPLYGQLDMATQDRAILPAAAGQRKVVLATAIAETSLTIEGIRIVIDAGLMRKQRFDPNTGLTRLVTLPVSQAAADQRCGRAGRLQAGVCYRLWSSHHVLAAHSPPEILDADLAPLVLELAQWGVHDTTTLSWSDPPPAAHIAQATELLQQLGALDSETHITAHGRNMLQLGTHPRLAHMILRAKELGYGALACELAALLGERDPLRSAQMHDGDMVLRLEWLRGSGTQRHSERGLRQTVRETARRWQRQLDCDAAPADHNDLALSGALLAFAYPDRIAQRRDTGHKRFVLSNGRGAHFVDNEPLARHDYIVAVNLEGTREARIFLAASVNHEQLMQYHSEQISERCFVDWDDTEQCVRARCHQCLGGLVLADEPWLQAEPQAIASTLLSGIRRAGSACLPWDDGARRFQQRVAFMHQHAAPSAPPNAPKDWPDISDDALMATLDDWLAPYVQNMSRLTHLKKLDLLAALQAQLSWAQQQQLEAQAPSHWTVPSGSRVRIDYSQDPPVLAVRLQEMFGQLDTPRIAGGRVPLLIHLLSPARRPIQVTQDLAAFWQGSYHEVKKEMKGRYPKHPWPDDPLQAKPTTRTKAKRQQK